MTKQIKVFLLLFTVLLPGISFSAFSQTQDTSKAANFSSTQDSSISRHKKIRKKRAVDSTVVKMDTAQHGNGLPFSISKTKHKKTKNKTDSTEVVGGTLKNDSIQKGSSSRFNLLKKKKQQRVYDDIGDSLNPMHSAHNKSKKKPENVVSNKDSVAQQPLNNTVNTPTVSDTATLKELTPEEIAYGLMQSGEMNLKGDHFEQAIFYYNKVIGNYPFTTQFVPALFYRAKCHLGMNELDGAMQDITLFIKLDNCLSALCSEAYYTRGNIYFNMGDYVSADTDFMNAAKDSTFKNYKFCFFYKALCEGETNNYIQSVQDFTKFLNIDNLKTVNSAEALYYRGFYKVKLEDNRGAIKDYDKAIELYQLAVESAKGNSNVYMQKLIDTYITRALAKSEIKKYDEAITDYNAVIKLSPNYAIAYRLKGLAEIGKGDLDNGCLDLSKAGELGSTDAYEDIKQHCK